MKRFDYKLSAALLACVTLLVGCRADDAPFKGDGTLKLTTSISSDMAMSRAAYDEASLADNCLLWISNAKGPVRKYQGLSAVPAEGIKLVAGHYVAEAWTGDSVPASFDARYYTGVQEFDITSGNTTSVALACRIANTVVAVNYADELDNVITEYSMTVGHSGHDLVFEGRDDERRGYYMMSSKSKNISWTFSGKLGNGDTFTRTGTIENAKRSTIYTLNVNFTSTDTEVGGAYFTIDVDETAIEVKDEIVIKIAPDIQGIGFDISEGIYAKPGKLEDLVFYISAATAMRKVVVECEDFITIAGLSGADVDLLAVSDEYREMLRLKGIGYSYNYEADEDVSAMRIELNKSFTSQMADGHHEITVTATDADGRENYETLVITIAEGEPVPVVTNTVAAASVWATKATVSAAVKSEPQASEYGFRYRKAGDAIWTGGIVAVPSSGSMKAVIDNLEPATTYEVVAYADAELAENTVTFTTESASQLPNASFENTYTSGSTIFFADNQANLFWDTGNTGSSAMNKNVTMPDASISHTGSQSIKLSSQYVGIVGIVGKFAAGNLFIGKYLKTSGTDGILGWGRPFSSRPKALKGWIKYRPASVEYVNSDYPEVNKGDLDKGIVYLALLTEHTESFEGASYPVIIKTKSSERQLFDKNASNVIAYGEHVWDAATDGEALVEFTIDLTYYREDIKPSNIMLVAAASKGGDYFVGGQSTMWLDDLELIY